MSAYIAWHETKRMPSEAGACVKKKKRTEAAVECVVYRNVEVGCVELHAACDMTQLSLF